jgi:hypothetical protein
MSDGLTAARARELLEYSPESGVLKWKVGPSNKIAAGTPIGSKNASGYVRFMIDERSYMGHRVAWLLQTGEWPEKQVDHINGVRADNRWSNLRAATGTQNNANSRVYRNNTSGFKGVCWDRAKQKWRAYIQVGGKVKRLGLHVSKEDAASAYGTAAEKYFGEFARRA